AGTTMSFVYDAVGNRTKRTDYMGRKTHYEYDILNRLTKIKYGDPVPTGYPPNLESTYSYDDISRLTSAVNNVGTVAFTYDNRSRLKSTTDVFGHNVEYAYDPNSNRTQLKLDSAVQTTYNYDAANRLTTQTDDASQNFVFGYDIANKLISKALPNGVSTTYEYDGMSRLKRLKDFSATATLFDRQYNYNNANQIASIYGPEYMPEFEYDNVNRLTSTVYSANLSSLVSFTGENYAYDAVGNRTSSHLSNTYSYQPFNRLTATQTSTQSYDANGNMVQKSEGSNFWRYTWDYENRLVEASTRKQKVRYKYDALGRRVQRYLVGNKENTKFIYDGLDVVLDDDKGVITKYQNGPGIDNKLSIKQGTVTNYFLADHLGSTNGLADNTGALTASNSYDSFGNPTNSAFSSRYQFTGREFDSFSGLQFSRARFFDPKLGRFISEDPIGFEGGDVNLYGYVHNNPTNRRDPLGLIDPIVYQDPRMYQSNFQIFNPGNPTIIDHAVGDGGIFTQQTFSEFLSAVERSKRRCKSTWTQRFWNDFTTTNAALPGVGAPSVIPGVGLGVLTAGATARQFGTMTALQWAMNGFKGATLGGVAGAASVNFVRVTAAYEVGVATGSAINATFGFTDYCPCEQ
ncbi:MAG: RHS repeat domain-containing protein, partial [Pyrinomonadaceae bacterium]